MWGGVVCERPRPRKAVWRRYNLGWRCRVSSRGLLGRGAVSLLRQSMPWARGSGRCRDPGDGRA